jgi:hypothetical protein
MITASEEQKFDERRAPMADEFIEYDAIGLGDLVRKK